MKSRFHSRVSIILVLVLFISVIELPGWQHTAAAAQSGAGSQSVVSIASGERHSLALKADGSVVAWGRNNVGQTDVPTEAQSGVIAIAAGGNHSMALKAGGSVVAWGDNNCGQVNVPTEAQSGVVAIAGGGNHSLALKADGSVIAWGYNFWGQSIVPADAQSGVVAIAAGYGHSLALKADGSVVVWGDNVDGQKNIPIEAQSGVSAIASGRDHVLALKTDGSVVAWGDNFDGQVNVPANAQTGIVSIEAGRHFSMALKANGSVVVWGDNVNGQKNIPIEAQSGVVAVAGGYSHALALKADGSVVMWGSNAFGQQNVPAELSKPVKGSGIAAGGYHSLALKSDGGVAAWGQNDEGQTSVPTEAGSGVLSIAAGGTHSLALKSNGSVIAWGDDGKGQASVPVEAGSNVMSIAAGQNHSLALKSDGGVVAWGYNYWGQSSVPTEAKSDVVSIAAGANFSMALKSNGSVVAWGGENFAMRTIPIEAQSGVIAIAGGGYHALALKSDGSVVAWGSDNYGQATVPAEAQSGIVAITAGYYHSTALKADGGVVAWGNNYAGQTSVPTLAKSGVVAISTGIYHNLALKSDGTVVAWNRNDAGQGNIPNNADLSGLTLDGAAMSPSFVPDVTSYTAYVGSVATDVNVTATLADPVHAELFINGAYETSASAVSVPLTGDSTVIQAHVEPYLSAGKSYTITIMKDATAPAVSLGMNGNETYAITASTTVAVSDGESGVDPDSLQAVWTESPSTPDGGAAWSGFSSGDTLSHSGANGDWYLHIRASDEVGNVVAAGSNRFRLDNGVPIVSFGTNGNESYATTASTAVTVSDSESGVDSDSLQYVWTQTSGTPDDSAGWASFSSGDILSHSGVNGDWYLHIRASDEVGNDVAAGSNRFRLDNGAPVVSLGTNGNEAYATTASTTVTVSDGESGVDPDSLQAVWTQSSSTPDGGAAWASFASGDTLSHSGANGDWYLHIRASDEVGNDVAAGSNRFRLDNMAPMVEIELQKQDSSAYTSGSWTNQNVTAGISASDGLSGLDSLQYSLDNGSMWEPYSAPLSFTAEGAHTLLVRAADKAGNISSPSRMINISRSGLELDVALKLDNGSTYTAGDWVNQSVTASVNSKQTTGGVTVTSTTYSLDGGSFWQPYVAPFSFSSEGQHTLDVKAVDSADNELTASYVVRVDTIVPVVHLGTNGNETYATSASTAVTVSDNGGGIDLSSLQYVWTQSISTPDGGAAWSGFASGDSLSKTGVDGDWYLHVQAKDIAGNEVQVGSNRFRLDNSAPEAVLGTNGKETYAMSASTVVTVSDNGGGVDPSSLQYVWTQSASTPDGGAAWSGFASGDTLSKSGVDGDWYVHVQAKDVAGNELQVGSPRFRLDNSAPEAVLGTNGNEMYAMSASTAVTVSDNGSGVDPSSLQAVWTQSASTPDGGAAWSGFANGDILSKSGVDGDWYLHIRAVDAAGNAMDAGSNRFRLDNSAPEAAFGTNGNESSANWASTTVTVSDSDSGVDPSSLQYVWTNSASAPAGDEEWTGFASGDDLKKSGVDGEWYLHVRGMDFVGNTLQAVSNRFKLFTLVLPIVNNQAGFYEDSQLLDRINTIQKMTRADGTTIEKVTIYEATLNQALKKLEKDLLTIRVNDMERVVQVQLPAKSLQSAVQSEPNLTIEVELSGSRYQLPMSAIHWEQIAEKLGLALENMKVNVTLEQMNSDSEAGLRQLAADQGLRLASRVIDFKVTVEAGGEIFEIGDFGGTYMTRAIVIDEAEEVSTLIGVRVEPEKNTFRFVPSLPGTRADGKAEMVMNVPHNSLYAAVEPTGKSFADLTGHWAKGDVELLATKRIVEGAGPNRFAPNAAITRAEFTALLVRALGLSAAPSDETDSGFADVAPDAWYAPVVTAAVNAGLSQGYAGNTFRPHQPIRREELAALIDRARQFAANKQVAQADVAKTLDAFMDQATISDWARQAVANLVQDGIVQGRNENLFEPKAHTTRAEAVVMLARLLRDLRFIAG